MRTTSAAAFCALILLATTAESRAFDNDRDFGWGAPFNSHLDSYSGRPLGPPLTALPPGYDYYDGRLIRVPYGSAQVVMPHPRPYRAARPKKVKRTAPSRR